MSCCSHLLVRPRLWPVPCRVVLPSWKLVCGWLVKPPFIYLLCWKWPVVPPPLPRRGCFQPCQFAGWTGSKITQQLLDRLPPNMVEGCGVCQISSHYISVWIRIRDPGFCFIVFFFNSLIEFKEDWWSLGSVLLHFFPRVNQYIA